MPQTVQKRNEKLVDLTSADFQRRYEPNFAWGNACSAITLLPGLRGFWPMSAQIITAQSLLVSDPVNNFHLGCVNIPVWGSAGLAPYIDFDGATQCAVYPNNAQFQIIGDETHILDKGLTLGCWCWMDAWGNVARPLMDKWTAANQYSYYLAATGAVSQIPGFGVSVDGINITAQVTSTPDIIPTGSWQFLAGRFIPSTSVCMWLNGTKYTSVAAVPATIFNGTSQFDIACGYFSADYRYFDGRISLAWLCASALSDTQLFAIYQQTRALYGA
jgi:hypothetical protein